MNILDIIKTAYNLRAVIIEKYFTLDKTLIENNHYHAMDPENSKGIIGEIIFLDVLRRSYGLRSLDSEIV